MTDTKQTEKPIAFFEFQGRGFYWAPNTAIGPVPVARKVEPMPLYSNQQAQPEPSKIEPWQPMKTAPKDGVAVMVLLEGSDIPHAARWLNGVDDVHATVETVGAGWHLTWDGSPVSEYSGPRCWMCCPDEPYDKFAQQTAPRFAKTYCSQCGKEFCAGNYGFSHCEDHAKQAQPERAPSGIDFTAGEKQALIEVLELDGHSSDDFEPECPACTAWEKLTAAIKQGGQHD